MTHFNKRHYEAIAQVMQGLHPFGGAENENNRAVMQWRATVSSLALLFTSDNHLFDSRRFERACQPGANVRARKAVDVIQKTVAAVPVVLALAFGAGQAKAADQTAAIAKAEQAVVLATCKLNFLRDRPGAKKNDKEYFGFMFQCMSK